MSSVAEIIVPRHGIALRGPQHAVKDLELLHRGILDFGSLISGHSRHRNPVQVEVRDPRGRLKALRFTRNLRTNDGIDWQARQMGGGQITANFLPGFQQTNATGITLTAPTGTTAGKITDTNTNVKTGGAFASVLNQWIGCTVIMGNAMAHIVGSSASNGTNLILYFDSWVAANDPTVVVSAPTAGVYSVIPSSPSLFIGLAVNAGAQAVTDHTIGNITSGANAEIGSGMGTAPAGNGLARAYGQGSTNWLHTAGTNTYQIQVTFTATGTFTAVQQCGMFTGRVSPGDAASDLANVGLGGGVMVFENTFSSVNLNANDTLKVTWTVTY